MKPDFDIQRTGVVVAYDTATGEVLTVNEIYAEVASGADGSVPDEADAEETAKMARARRPDCTVNVLSLAARDLPEPVEDAVVEWVVDPKARRLSMRQATGLASGGKAAP